MTAAVQSVPWQISRAMLAALQASADLDHLVWLDNPAQPEDVGSAGARVAWIDDGDDTPMTTEKAAQQDIRTFSLRLGVAALPTDGQLQQAADAPALRLLLRQQVDADMVAIKRVVTLAWQAWRQTATTGRQPIVSSGASMREGLRSARIEGVPADAAAVMTAFDFQYQEAARSVRG